VKLWQRTQSGVNRVRVEFRENRVVIGVPVARFADSTGAMSELHG